MLVSIVIPVYNRAKVVSRTLNSVLEQSHRPIQLVLVDNDSSDDTMPVLRHFRVAHDSEDFRVDIVQEKRHTAGAARNKGFAIARGEWIMFFDSDDVMHPSLVASYVAQVKAGHADLVVVKCRLHLCDGRCRNLPFFTSDLLANELLYSIVATQRYMVHRPLLEQAGKWSEDLPCWNDLELGVRLLLQNPTVAFIDRALVHIYESGEASITGTAFSDKCGEWERALDAVQSHIACSTLKNKNRYLRLVDYRRIVLAGRYAAEGKPQQGKALYANACARLSRASLLLRFAMPLLYAWIGRGGRGTSRIARLLVR